MKFHTRFSRRRVSFSTTGPSLTVQSEKNNVDINTIIARYRKSGDASFLEQRSGSYEDVSQDFDLGESLRVISRAEQDFSALSSKVRKHFDNDPYAFFEYMHSNPDPEELYSLGLIEAKPAASASPGQPEAGTGEGETPPAEASE